MSLGGCGLLSPSNPLDTATRIALLRYDYHIVVGLFAFQRESWGNNFYYFVSKVT